MDLVDNSNVNIQYLMWIYIVNYLIFHSSNVTSEYTLAIASKLAKKNYKIIIMK